MMMMGMNTLARRKHNFRDRRKGNVIIRPDTKRSSVEITRPVINILDTDCFPKEGSGAPVACTCGAPSTQRRFREPKRAEPIPFPSISGELNVRQLYRKRFDYVFTIANVAIRNEKCVGNVAYFFDRVSLEVIFEEIDDVVNRIYKLFCYTQSSFLVFDLEKEDDPLIFLKLASKNISLV